MIMDSSYSIVKSVQTGLGKPGSDEHEFHVLPDGKSALVTIYQPLVYDLSSYGITKGWGYIMDCSMQEIEIDTGKVLFQWSANDHVDPKESMVPAGSSDASGSGLTSAEPWDYL